MKRFLTNIALFTTIGLIPLLILLMGYIRYDPFKVLRPYQDYSYASVLPNRDYISTEMFIKNHLKYNYNSFILGSSRTLAFRPYSWKKYLKPTDSPFMFDASGESIYGIYTKLKYLDSTHNKIDNAIIVICRDVTFRYSGNHNGHLFIKHPATSLESNLSFQLAFFKAYLSPKFLFGFYMYTFTKEYKPYMSGYIENRKILYDTITNEIKILDQEEEITHHPLRYYKEHANIFYERHQQSVDSIARINRYQLVMLKDIRDILDKNHTKYKIVISPLYEQVKLHPKDYATLANIFKDHLYDFSGKNSFTDSKYNYYETNHFRPQVGDSILRSIYNSIPTTISK